MKVLFVFYSLSAGGVSKANLTLADEFLKKGFEVDVLTYVSSGRTQILNENLLFHTFGFDKFGLLEIFKSTFKLIFFFNTQKKYDLVISSSDLISLPVAIVKFFFRFQLIVNSHTNLIEHLKTKAFPLRCLYKIGALIIKSNAKLANVSLGAVSASKLFYKTNDVTLLPNPISPWSIIDNSKSLHPWFSKFKVIVACGRLTKSKNYELMLNSFMKLVEVRKDVKLIIIGDGEEREYLEQFVFKIGLENSVLFLGNVDEPRLYMQNSVFLYHTSFYEGAPMVLIEALSTDIPVVTTNFKSGANEILEGGKFGILINSYDVDSCLISLCEGLNLNLVDEGFYVKKANEYSPKICANKYVELYLKL